MPLPGLPGPGTTTMRTLIPRLPEWVRDWLDIIVPALQIVLILLVAWLLQRLVRKLMVRGAQHYQVPDELMVPLKGLVRWTIVAAALLLVLERLGVSATVLWTAFTGFATVGAVAFFAAWSVLSNLFCALLILTVRPFRVGDHIEVIDTFDKPGAKGRVVDINLLYTTLEDHHAPSGAAWLQIPNALVFQKVVRRWRDAPAPAHATPVAPGTAARASTPLEVAAPQVMGSNTPH